MEWRDILKRIEAGESRTVEFKAGFDIEKIARAACAFANSDGGVIVMGVTDGGRIVGLDGAPERTQERLTTLAGGGFSVPMMATCGHHQAPQGWVHWLRVFRQRHREPMQYKRRVWVRRERSSVTPSSQELQELYNRFGFVMTEEQLVSAAGPQDLDEPCFREYLSRLRLLRRRRSPARAPTMEDDYRNMGVLGDLDGRPALTLFGLMAFGKEPQSFSNTGSLFIQNTSYRTSKRNREVLSALHARGRIEEQIEQTTDWARTFGRREEYEGIRRVDRPLLPIDALREAVTNAVIHRDYAITGSPIHVDVFPDRIEILSPGTLPNGMTVARVRHGGNPKSRNEAMAVFAVGMGLMERRGVGWLIIEEAMEEFNGMQPGLEESRDERWVRVTLPLSP